MPSCAPIGYRRITGRITNPLQIGNLPHILKLTHYRHFSLISVFSCLAVRTTFPRRRTDSGTRVARARKVPLRSRLRGWSSHAGARQFDPPAPASRKGPNDRPGPFAKRHHRFHTHRRAPEPTILWTNISVPARSSLHAH